MGTNNEVCYFCSKKLKDNERICSNCGQDQKKSFNYLVLLACVVFLWIVFIIAINPMNFSISKSKPKAARTSSSNLFSSKKAKENDLDSYLSKLGFSKSESDEIEKLQEMYDPENYDLEESLKVSEDIMNSFFGTDNTDTPKEKVMSNSELTIFFSDPALGENTQKLKEIIKDLAKSLDRSENEFQNFYLNTPLQIIEFTIGNYELFNKNQIKYLKEIYSVKQGVSLKDGTKIFDLVIEAQDRNISEEKFNSLYDEIKEIAGPYYFK